MEGSRGRAGATITAMAVLALLLGAGAAAAAAADTAPDVKLSVAGSTEIATGTYEVTWRAEIANAAVRGARIGFHVANDGPTIEGVRAGGRELSCVDSVAYTRVCELPELAPAAPVDIVERVSLGPASHASLQANVLSIDGEVNFGNNHTDVTLGTLPQPPGGGGGGGNPCAGTGDAGPPRFVGTADPRLIVGTPFSGGVRHGGGRCPWLLSVSGGSFPEGLVIEPNTFRISGTPTRAGTFRFTLRITDAIGQIADQTFVWAVREIPPPPPDCFWEGRLPDPVCTRGAVVRRLGARDLCRGFRPLPARGAEAVRARVFSELYEIPSGDERRYVLDHLISVTLGGSNAVANVWPQPRDARFGPTQKNALERHLRREVCAGRLRLGRAWNLLVDDWERSYRAWRRGVRLR
jgi:Putative Ig domain